MNIPLWLYTYTYAICTNRCQNVRHRTCSHRTIPRKPPNAEGEPVDADGITDAEADADVGAEV